MANIFQRFFSRKAADKQAALPFQLIWTGQGFTMIPANTESYIKHGYNANSAVYSIVTALMQKFAAPPFYLYKVKSQKQLERYKAETRNGYNPNAMLRKAAAMDELNDSHPIAQLLHKPNTYQSENEFRQMWLCFLKLHGFAPVYVNKGLVGTKPLSIHALPPQWVTLAPDATLMDAAKVFFSPFKSTENELPRDCVYLAKYVNPDFQTDGSHLYGLSPIKAGLMDLKGSNEAAKQMAKMYENGGARGVFAPKDMAFSKEQISNFREVLDMWINGSDARGKIGGLSLPLDFHNVGLDAVDMGLLNGRQLTDERIATIFNYPPALLKADNKFDNATAAIRYVVTNSLYSDFEMYKALWNNFILPMYGETGQYYVDYDLSVLPEMQSDMEKLVAQAKEMWWTSPNEKRLLTKYDTIRSAAMDTIFIPTGFTPIEETMMVDDVSDTAGDYSDSSGDNSNDNDEDEQNQPDAQNPQE